MSAKVKNLDRVFRKLSSVLDVANRKDVLTNLGQFASDRIVNTTKSGKSLVTDSKILGLKNLTIKIRKWWKEKGKPVGRLFSPRRSNLTMTGQMLDAVQFKVIEAEKKVNIFVAPTSRPIEGPTLRGQRPERLTNEQVARKVAKDGRPFMGMDDLGKRRMIEQVRRTVREEIKKQFK